MKTSLIQSKRRPPASSKKLRDSSFDDGNIGDEGDSGSPTEFLNLDEDTADARCRSSLMKDKVRGSVVRHTFHSSMQLKNLLSNPVPVHPQHPRPPSSLLSDHLYETHQESAPFKPTASLHSRNKLEIRTGSDTDSISSLPKDQRPFRLFSSQTQRFSQKPSSILCDPSPAKQKPYQLSTGQTSELKAVGLKLKFAPANMFST